MHLNFNLLAPMQFTTKIILLCCVVLVNNNYVVFSYFHRHGIQDNVIKRADLLHQEFQTMFSLEDSKSLLGCYVIHFYFMQLIMYDYLVCPTKTYAIFVIILSTIERPSLSALRFKRELFLAVLAFTILAFLVKFGVFCFVMHSTVFYGLCYVLKIPFSKTFAFLKNSARELGIFFGIKNHDVYDVASLYAINEIRIYVLFYVMSIARYVVEKFVPDLLAAKGDFPAIRDERTVAFGHEWGNVISRTASFVVNPMKRDTYPLPSPKMATRSELRRSPPDLQPHLYPTGSMERIVAASGEMPSRTLECSCHMNGTNTIPLTSIPSSSGNEQSKIAESPSSSMHVLGFWNGLVVVVTSTTAILLL